MKKKNGFTLIELLGVIVILAIILAIVIMNLSKINNDTRDKYNDKQKDEIIEASKEYFTTNNNYLTDLNDGYSVYVSLGTLVKEDYLNKMTSTNKNEFNKCDIVLVSKTNGKLKYEYIDEDTAVNSGIITSNNCSLTPVVINSVVIKTTTVTTTKPTTETSNNTTKKDETTSKKIVSTTSTTTKKSITTTTTTIKKTTQKPSKEICDYDISQYDKGYLYSLKIRILNKNIKNFYYVVWNKKETKDTSNKYSGSVSSKCKLTNNLISKKLKTGNDMITAKISMLKKNGRYVKNQYYCFAVKPVSGNSCVSWKVQYKHAHLY